MAEPRPRPPIPLLCFLAVGAFQANAGLGCVRRSSSAPGPPTAAPSDTGRCRHQTPSRDHGPQGTLLWGTRQSWNEDAPGDERTSVLASVTLGEGPGAPSLHGARLVGGSPGAVLRGENSDGQPAEVAVCGAEPAAGDPEQVWYWIEVWNPVARDWANPCAATASAPDPRALALSGTWDASGAHHADPRKITFACETGALSKCAAWGYRPWASANGRSLADAHQACTRMVRADYCGNGRSHTTLGQLIDYYDGLGVASRTTRASPEWDPARASFEAAWTPDGAACFSRTRLGQPLEAVLAECPGRFRASAADLGDGDRCLMERTDRTAALLRNRSFEPPRAGR